MNIVTIIRGVGQLKGALEAGKEVSNPTEWKERSITANRIAAILAFIIVVLKLTGIELPVSDDTIEIAAGGVASILFVVNNIITIISSKKVGSKPK